MTDFYTLETVSKRHLIDAFEMTPEEAKLVHRYRIKLPVMVDAEGVEGFCIDLRVLHKQLGVKTRFNDWIKVKIEYMQVIDSIGTENSVSSKSCTYGADVLRIESLTQYGQVDKVDYFATVTSAKMIAMSEHSEDGFMIKRYFATCETLLHRMARRNPIRGECRDTSKKLIGTVCTRVAEGRRQKVIQNMHKLVCVIATGATPQAWRDNMGVQNVRDYLKCNATEAELDNYKEVLNHVTTMSKDPTQTNKTIRESCERIFGESNVYEKYLNLQANSVAFEEE